MWKSSSNTEQEQKSCWQMQRMPLDMLQLNESIPYVSSDHFKKAIGEGRRLVAAGNRQKFVGLGGRDAEKMCQRSAVERRRPIRDLEESNVEQHGFSLSRVCPHCGLFPIRRFHFGGCRPTINPGRRGIPIGGARLVVQTIQACCMPEDTGVQGTRATSRRLRQNDGRVEVTSELAGEKDFH